MDIEARMGRLLQTGVLLAGSTMMVGGAIYLALHGGEAASYGSFHTVPPDLKSIGGVLRSLPGLHGADVIQFAVLIMIATPVLRVAFAVFAFARERDWLYTGISMVVLSLLGYALLGAG